MKDQLSATIIPFPVRSRPVAIERMEPVVVRRAEPLATPVAPSPQRAQTNNLSSSSQRLTEALAHLSAALADQKDATQRWKAAIEDLAVKMRTLGDLGVGNKKIG